MVQRAAIKNALANSPVIEDLRAAAGFRRSDRS
jgi:hypothetical protein